MHLQIYPLLLVVGFRTALTTALPQQTFDSGQKSQDMYAPYSNIPQDKWPRYKGQLVDPKCILNILSKEHRKREWPKIPQPVYPSPEFCPAWQKKDTETETDREDRELCADGFEPKCCVGKGFGFGLGTAHSPCHQYTTAVQCKTQYAGETYCCEIFPAFSLDGSPAFNCRPVTFVSVPTFHASSSSSSPYFPLENSFADETISSLEIPSDTSDQGLINSAAAADWTADFGGNNYINIADASNADLGHSEVVSNTFWVD